ncbi:hypothetical protein KQI89_09090 [Clostridium sp. MSJ-4]|uniref:Mannosyl-glycoprotein endo-beta-N-acetylglucosamidase-like domain-containing protein n=1 Tax=Clostridium simiarum TaxID=2841506 RepID=A0ABS6F0A3_9CLOT|nr:hypothetical protein [Clostridium simiarum]MBU5591921.1 hypothetical protein [Clostridium simiarum]
MKKVLDELNKIKVLDKSDIVNIRSYINDKYPENAEKENAIILSDTVDKIIYKRLEGLPDNIKFSVKNHVIKNTLGKDKILITLCDIFQTCITEENIIKSFKNELINWVGLNAKIEITAKDINKHLQSIGFKDISSSVLMEQELNFEIQGHMNNSIEELHGLKDKKLRDILPNWVTNSKHLKRVGYIAIIVIFIIPFYNFSRGLYFTSNKDKEKVDNYVIESDKKEDVGVNHPNLHLPEYMRYEKVNKEKLKEFLNKRNSLLCTEPYFSTIFSVAKEFNLNPIVLFAITGQEQNFVPKSDKDAEKIANNPFNVFHSWMEYNTDINDASRIASRTVINLSKNREEDKDPFLWIGRKYAEDPRWGKGVRLIFEELTEYIK